MTTTTTAPAPNTSAAAADARARWLALLVLCLGDLMIVLDGTIVNVALPSIRDDLGFDATSLAWVANAYLLTFGGFLLLGGRLGDLFGQRRMFLIGIVLFTAASVACGMSTTQGMLVVSRAVQGLGGALVSAVALSLLMTLFTDPQRAGEGDGDLRVRAVRRRRRRRAAGRRPDRPAQLALDLPGQRPGGRGGVPAVAAAPARHARAGGRRPHRRGRRDHRHRRADARGVRDRERQRVGLGLRADARAARRRRRAARRVPGDRVADVVAARAARPVPQHIRLGGQRRSAC